MCGIVGGICLETSIKPLLLEGLERLEYRGYDSAGFALVEPDGKMHQLRAAGKVEVLATRAKALETNADLGIAHTRWATHGAPVEKNAHPHLIDGRLLIVHNGIIENYRDLYARLGKPELLSDTDTEVFGWVVLRQLQSASSYGLRKALAAAAKQCIGSYAALVIDLAHPESFAAIRRGSPLALGVSAAGVFVASDPLALIQHTGDFIILEEGESVEAARDTDNPARILWNVYSATGRKLKREPKSMVAQHYTSDKGDYEHYMLKEIDQQPRALADTLESLVDGDEITFDSEPLLETMGKARAVQIVGCGTSAHAAMVARYWMEELAGIHCWVEVASEFRYRNHAQGDGVLYLTLSQSGETADTLECLRLAREMDYLGRLAITNSPHSSIVREADYALLSKCGVEVSVASTKAFTTQLLVLLVCALKLAQQRRRISARQMQVYLRQLRALPEMVQRILDLRDEVAHIADELLGKHGVMFLGRHSMFPVALEGALKLKEIAYIHAEAYPAGELKHGPLALIDNNTPVVAVSPPSELLHKLHSNLEEVQARGAVMLLFIDAKQKFVARPFDRVMKLPHAPTLLTPFAYTVPLQLLAYYTAVKSGTDVDKPRNLAKSVTVE